MIQICIIYAYGLCRVKLKVRPCPLHQHWHPASKSTLRAWGGVPRWTVASAHLCDVA